MAVRFLASAVVAFLITYGLFFLMQFLISKAAGEVKDVGPNSVIEFVRLKRDETLETKKRELPKKKEPPKPPPPPEIEQSAPQDTASGDMAIAAAMPDLTPQLEGGINLGNAPSDTDATPLVRVPPIYPPRAAERGIEGWVVVEYTIAGNGTVKEARAIASEPGNIFNRAAVKAVLKWKFKPKIVDGKPVEQPGKQTRLTFELNT